MTTLKIKTRNPGNSYKFKSLDIFLIKKNAEEITLMLQSDGYLLDAGDPALEYLSKQSEKLVKSVGDLIEKYKISSKKIA